MRKYIIIAVVVAAIGGMFWTFYYLYKKSKPRAEKTELTQLKQRTIKYKSVAPGTISPRQEIAVKSQVAGIADEILVEPGQYVNKGDLLARIRIIPDVVTLNNAESRLKQAEIDYRYADQEWQRHKKLKEEGAITDFDFRTYENQQRKAAEDLEAAKSNLDLVLKGSSQRVSNATNMVRATASGMVLDVPLKEGASVIPTNNFNEGTTICVIANMNDMLFIGKVDEGEVGKINVGMPIDIKIGAIPDTSFGAVLEFISPKGVDEEGAIKFEVKAALKLRKTDFIRSGYSASASIILEKKEMVWSVPESLIQYGKDSVYVEVRDTKDTAQFNKVLIKKGLSDGIHTEVLEGLTQEQLIKVPLRRKL